MPLTWWMSQLREQLAVSPGHGVAAHVILCVGCGLRLIGAVGGDDPPFQYQRRSLNDIRHPNSADREETSAGREWSSEHSPNGHVAKHAATKPGWLISAAKGMAGHWLRLSHIPAPVGDLRARSVGGMRSDAAPPSGHAPFPQSAATRQADWMASGRAGRSGQPAGRAVGRCDPHPNRLGSAL